MNESLNLKIYTPNKLIISDTIKSIKINGREGNFCILPKHVDYITSFIDGILSYKDMNNKEYFIAINDGIFIKIKKEIEISVFNCEISNSLEELQKQVVMSSDKFDKVLEQEKQLATNSKLMEFFIFEKILKFNKL